MPVHRAEGRSLSWERHSQLDPCQDRTPLSVYLRNETPRRHAQSGVLSSSCRRPAAWPSPRRVYRTADLRPDVEDSALATDPLRPSMSSSQRDTLAINTLRFLSADAVQQANSGHPGLPMGAASLAYVLWTRHLRFDPSAPKWADRDRFVLSAGHGSMLLYSLLHLSGFDLPLAEIQRFRQWGSKTPGHPEFGLAPGVETTTGPLGQGFTNGVGMTMAAHHLAARYNQEG